MISTQLPAAQAINATCDSPIETLFQRNRVSSISVNGCQLSAATRPRLPNASLRAPVRHPLIVASRLSTVLNYSPSVSCRNSTVTGGGILASTAPTDAKGRQTFQLAGIQVG